MKQEEMDKILHIIDCYVSDPNESGILYSKIQELTVE